MLFRIPTFFFLLLIITLPAGAVTPSQVLVLYNADWIEDRPLTEKGQDSQEIAEHYINMHTDPDTGEKPYILGLNCDHGVKVLDEARHLNEVHLAEDSHDNLAGVVLTRKPFLLEPASPNDQLRDSRMVEFTLPGGRSKWDIETLHVEVEPAKGDPLTLAHKGLIVGAGQIAGNNTDAWTLRANVKSFVNGPVTLKASCVDVEGKKHSWEAEYVDVDDVELSCTGEDGKRDDLNFLEDVAQPVKAFLEDPKQARADGTLLKDHILFMVVCYGLPRTAIAPCGIARGITENIGNYGAIIDFGQRLQLLYYDLDKVMGTQLRGYRYAGKSPFSDFFFRSPQSRPLMGKANPFVHPQLYTSGASLSKGPQPPAYTSENRSRNPERFLYFVSRIDAPDPLQAKALIDRSVYASTYAGPQMGILPDKTYSKDKQRVGALERSGAGTLLWEHGYRYLYYAGQGRNLLECGRLTPEDGFLNDGIAYLPGGIAATVISHNGWNNGEMVKDLNNGVTATAGAARVYHGAPHIHNKSWWDDDIFYSALLHGRTLGEAWLMNQIHLGWITTFVGDPMMTWAGKYAASPHPLKFDADKDVRFKVVKGEKNHKEVWLQVDLNADVAHPQVAQLEAVSVNGKRVISSTFDAFPSVCLGAKDESSGEWTLRLMTPFGHKVEEAKEVSF
jgi:hypothetical protein